MNILNNFFQNNHDVTFFIYGMSFIIISTMILVKQKNESDFKIAGILFLFVLYAFPHGIADFIKMWIIIKGENILLTYLANLITYCSYIFLFEFGRKIFIIIYPDLMKYSLILYPTLILTILGLSFLSRDFLTTFDVLIGYFIRFPAGIMIGLGLIIYFKRNQKKLSLFKLKYNFFLGGFAFLFWAFFCGIVRSKGDFFPSNVLNIESFFIFFNVPVYIFRSICALVIVWSISGILTIFNWESLQRTKDAYESEKEMRKNFDNIFKQIADSIIIFDKNKKIVSMNKASCKLLGYKKSEMIGKPILHLIENSFQIDNIIKKNTFIKDHLKYEENFISKSEERIPVIISFSSYYNYMKNSHGYIAIAKDIKERKCLESELKEAYLLKTKQVKDRTFELEKKCDQLNLEIDTRRQIQEDLLNSQHFLQRIIDNITDSIVVINKDLKIVKANVAAKKYFNENKDRDNDFKNSHCYNYIPSNKKPCQNKQGNCLLDIVKKENKLLTYEFKNSNENENGDDRYYELVANPFYNKKGEFEGIIKTIRDISERKILEKEIINISEKERIRIGQDIHDDIAQNLAAIDILIKIVYNKLKENDREEKNKMYEIIQFISNALSKSRILAQGLCPVNIKNESLSEAIRNLCSDMTSIFDINCNCQIEDNIYIDDSFVIIQLYYIAKESINNIIKHSNADEVSVILKQNKTKINLEIVDNGSGFDVDNSKSNGLGLRIMNYRANVIGCDLHIISKPDWGTSTICEYNLRFN